MPTDNQNVNQYSLARRYGFAAIAWSVLLAALLAWDLYDARQDTLSIAASAARSNIHKDMAFRQWATSHGGVYVPPTAHTPPNPYLNVPDRDVVTRGGKALTLMNPAYMLRQMQEDSSEHYGIRSHITSLKLLNPNNAPDAWEAEALHAFEQGETERTEEQRIGGKPYLRMMLPLLTEPGCLKCHGHQGYRVGDVRGGVSSAVPLEDFQVYEWKHKQGIILALGAIWLTGLLAVGFWYRRNRRLDAARRVAESALIASEAGLKEAQRLAQVGSWELDIVNNRLGWSDEIYRIFEIDPAKFSASYEAFLNAIHPDDREKVNAAYTDSLRERRPYNIVHRLLMGDGRVKYVREICQTAYGSDGKPLRSTGTVQDITLQHEAEEKIIRLNRTLRTISACDESLVRSRDEEELLREVCRHIVETGGHMLAWVVYPGDEPHCLCRPAAHFGDEVLFRLHDELQHSVEHTRHCLTAAALRTRRPVVCNRLLETTEYSLDRNLQALGVNAILAVPLHGEERLYGVLTIFSGAEDAFDPGEVRLVEELAANIAYGIGSIRTMAERDKYLGQFGAALKNTVAAIARTLEMRDPYTAGHQVRVADLASAIAAQMGLPAERVQGIHLAGTVHDIGKIHIPAEILSKPGRLSEIEFNFIKTHSQAGYDLLKDIEFPWPIAQMVWQHHERLDGSGYPQGLKGDQIILEARILSVADVVEAMSAHRPYRAGLGIEPALAEIGKHSGILYDTLVVEACLTLFREKNYTLPAGL